MFRRFLTSSGMSSSNRLMAIVPGRGEYLKMNEFLNRISFSRSTVRSNSSSVSVGKPTMKSDARNVGHVLAGATDEVAVLAGGVAAVRSRGHGHRRVGRHVQALADHEQSRIACSASSVKSRGYDVTNRSRGSCGTASWIL